MSDAELQLLMDMGFPRERAYVMEGVSYSIVISFINFAHYREKALSAVGNQGLEAAAEWYAVS